MFADNQRISGIQMERQFFLTYLGPVMLWIAPKFPGRYGIFSMLAGALFLCIWVFFLMRQSHIFHYPEKYWGKYMRWVIWLIYESYLILTGGWLAAATGNILQEYMIQGISGWLIVLLVVVTAWAGNATMQARGRFAQTVWPIVGGIVFLMLLFAAFQGQGGYGQEIQVQQMMENGDGLEILETSTWNREAVVQTGKQVVWYLSCMLGTVFLPFIRMEYGSNEKSADQTGVPFKIIGKIVLWTGTVILLLWTIYGKAGAEMLEYPVLDMMAGVRIPGGFIRRMDMIFLTVILCSLLFALSSILFYSKYIFCRFGGKPEAGIWGNAPAAILCFILGSARRNGWSLIQDYMGIVSCIYLPLFLTLTCCNALLRRRFYGKQKNQA